MARIDADELEGGEGELVFIARRIDEAERAEALLSDEGIDYALAFEPFLHGGIFGVRTLTGVGFYVATERAGACREILGRSGLGVGIVEEPS